MLVVWYEFFSSVLAECIVFMSLFLLHVLGYFDLFVWIFFTINSDFDRPERKGQGAKVPGSEMARERVGQGVNRPESYWPIRSGERIGPGAKRLGTQSECCDDKSVSQLGITLKVNKLFNWNFRKRWRDIILPSAAFIILDICALIVVVCDVFRVRHLGGRSWVP